MDKDFLDQIFDVDCNGKVEDFDFIIDSQIQKQLESPKFYDEDDEDDKDQEYDVLIQMILMMKRNCSISALYESFKLLLMRFMLLLSSRLASSTFC